MLMARDMARCFDPVLLAEDCGVTPDRWQADLLRQNAIQSTGIVLLRIAARRLWTEPDAVISEIRAFLGLPFP